MNPVFASLRIDMFVAAGFGAVGGIGIGLLQKKGFEMPHWYRYSWFKVEWHIGAYVEGARARYYKLSKINNSGRTLEFVLSKIEYSTEIDPKHSDYHILYRQ